MHVLWNNTFVEFNAAAIGTVDAAVAVVFDL